MISGLKRPSVGEWGKDEAVLWKINVPKLCDFSILVFFLNFSLETYIKKRKKQELLCNNGALYINGDATSFIKYSRVVLVKVLRSKYCFYYKSGA